MLAVEQRLEVALLLLVGAVVGDDLGVAGVGGLGAEDDRGPLRAPEDLVHEGQLHLPVALASRARGRGGRPTGPGRGPAASAGRRSARRVSSSGWKARPRQSRSMRLDLLAHEGVHPVELLPGTRARSRTPIPCCITPLRRPAVSLRACQRSEAGPGRPPGQGRCGAGRRHQVGHGGRDGPGHRQVQGTRWGRGRCCPGPRTPVATSGVPGERRPSSARKGIVPPSP